MTIGVSIMKEFFKGLIILIIISIIGGILIGFSLYSSKCKAIKEYHMYDESDVSDDELIYGEFPFDEYISLNIIKNDKPIFNYELNCNFIDITMSPFALLEFYLIAPVIIIFVFLFITIPNPQSPIPNPQLLKNKKIIFNIY